MWKCRFSSQRFIFRCALTECMLEVQSGEANSKRQKHNSGDRHTPAFTSASWDSWDLISQKEGVKSGDPWQTPTSTGKVFHCSEDFETALSLVTQMAYDSLGTPYSCTPTGLLMEHSRRRSPSSGNKCIMNKDASIMPDAPAALQR